MGYPAIAAERMEDVDKEISFLEEKIAEMRERSDILKTSTPRPAASRDSGVDTMRRASDTSQKKGELSLRTGHTTALHLEDAAAAYETGAYSGLRSNKRTEAHPRSNDQFSDSYELYEESERKVESSIGHRPFASCSGAAHKPDLNWQADSLLPSVTRRRSRVRFESPARGNETDNAFAKQSIKPATYDGSGPWLDYHAHFEACADINGWSYATKGLYLAVSLRGNAQGVLGNMPRGTKPDFDSLVQALEDRFAPPSQTELYRVQMRERRQRAGETLPELGQAIQRLAYLAYPTASTEIRETLAKDQFVDALVDSEMRIRIKQSRPRHLNDAIQLAVELEAYNKAERKSYARPTAPEPGNDALARTLDALNAKIDSLQLEVKSFKSSRAEDDAQLRPRVREQQKLCYYCRKSGHIQRDCRTYRQNRPESNGYARNINVDHSYTEVVEMIKRLSDKVDSLQTNVKRLSKRQMTDNGRKVDKLQGVCYYCRKPGHLRKACMVRKRAKCGVNSEQPEQSKGTDGDEKGQHLTKGKTNACYRVVAMSICNDRKVLIEGRIGSSGEKFATDSISSMVGRTFKDPSHGHDLMREKSARTRADVAAVVRKADERGECAVFLGKC